MKFGALKVKRILRLTPNNIPLNNELTIRYSIPVSLNDTGKNIIRHNYQYDEKTLLSRAAAFALCKYLQTNPQNKVIRVEGWEVCKTTPDEFYLFVNVVTSV